MIENFVNCIKKLEGVEYKKYSSLYPYCKSLDCIGLILKGLEEINHPGARIFNYISKHLYLPLNKDKIFDIYNFIKEMNFKILNANNEKSFLKGDILMFKMPSGILHFGVVIDIIDSACFLVHASNEVKKIVTVILDNSLKKHLLNIIRILY